MYRFRKSHPLITLLGGVSLFILVVVIFVNFQSTRSTFALARQVTASPPQAGQMTSNWLVRPSFAGKVLHWTQMVYNYTPGGPDPANGKAMNGDIWEIVGNDGIPTTIHVRYTLPNGTVLQEFTQTQTMATFYFSTAYHRSNACAVDNKTSSTNALLSTLPLFVRESLLPSNGYMRVNQGIEHPFPITSPLAGVTSLQTYNSEGNVHSWLFSGSLSSGMKHTYAMDTNQDGRIVATEIHLFGAKGALIQDSWHTYGQLQVYSNRNVSGSALAFMNQKGECDA